MTQPHTKYTQTGEQGQINLAQMDAIYRCLIGVRATLRRMVLAQHAEHLQQISPAFALGWEDAVAQTFVEIGHLVNETHPEALEDDPLPDDYFPPL